MEAKPSEFASLLPTLWCFTACCSLLAIVIPPMGSAFAIKDAASSVSVAQSVSAFGC